MNIKHELTMHAVCPVDKAPDHYAVTIETSRVVPVEAILEAVREPTEPTYQEEITAALARRLGARVTTIGYHSGVKTTCTAGLP